MTQHIKQQDNLGESADGVGVPWLQAWQITITGWLGVLMILVCLIYSINLRADESQKRFYTLVAAMITKVSDYSKWPEPVDKGHPGIARLAVLASDNNVFDFFDEAINNRMVGNLMWKVDRISSLEEAANYRFLYVESGTVILSKDWHQQFSEKGILTFGKSDTANCIFTYSIVDSRLQFQLDLSAAKQVGVGFDPRLVKLAGKVKHAPSNP